MGGEAVDLDEVLVIVDLIDDPARHAGLAVHRRGGFRADRDAHEILRHPGDTKPPGVRAPP